MGLSRDTFGTPLDAEESTNTPLAKRYVFR
ncbi:hypothetical protein Y039_5719 [Burkholderia pseudomallei MSHR1029]|nr:hypothetical protein Y597_3794 [Burkholderia pseudomallei MSHR1000]KGW66455.1 hypothetical protein Y039_5719 [Burkholderia pseudomallei MSHR1029]